MLKDRTCLIILGMHRSGTSALTGVLNLLGVDIGKKSIPPAPDNPKGFFENAKVTNFDEFVLLTSLKSSWDDLKALDEKNFEALKRFKEEGKSIIEEEFSETTLFAIKDPRMCILFPFWAEILEELQIKVKVVFILRNPLEVALSLNKRNGFSIEKGLLLWAKYNLYGEYFSRNYKRVFVYYDELLENPERLVEKIQEAHNITFPNSFSSVKDKINEFLSVDLRHNVAKTIEFPSSTPLYVVELYKRLFKSKSKIKNVIFDKLREEYLNAIKFYREALHYKESRAIVRYNQREVKKYFDVFNIDNLSYNFMGKKIVIGGLACLKREFDLNDFVLELNLEAGIFEQIEWGLPSPGYAKTNPEHPYSQNARFSVQTKGLSNFEISLSYKGQEKIKLAEVYLL